MIAMSCDNPNCRKAGCTTEPTEPTEPTPAPAPTGE
ncbi:hypothetical protein RVR_8382 [Actinacidiphila reveromycinica]|uniref:Uncharacterized protein n=1 Tax=Actinacidiphila reveromycinica TaxID=659352 RepID=A0A7U3VRS9_9ACTN|nr:hypothetical protein RVR_8382 [Streptomyces sp. SN-593]